jgi:hypothetical protein
LSFKLDKRSRATGFSIGKAAITLDARVLLVIDENPNENYGNESDQHAYHDSAGANSDALGHEAVCGREHEATCQRIRNGRPKRTQMPDKPSPVARAVTVAASKTIQTV